jgi:hypothetical protein
MNDSDPTWLRGKTRSKSSVLHWREEDDRQFCVLPFYEGNGVEQGRERYLLWGRALSDGRLYPIPTWWYSLDLVPDLREDVSVYQWVCQVFDFSRTPVRMELNSQAPLRHRSGESMLSRWMKRQISSHPNQCKARKARRSGLTLSFTRILASGVTFGAWYRSAMEGERIRSASPRDPSKVITP